MSLLASRVGRFALRRPRETRINTPLLPAWLTALSHPAVLCCRQAGVLLVAAPALLAMQSHTLEAKLQQLQSLADTHPSWTEAYCSCPCKSLAVLLTYSLERQLRLHYAAAHSLQAQ